MLKAAKQIIAMSTMRITKDGKVYRSGRRVYPNKDVYDGEFIDGLKHGKGTLNKFDSKDVYNGEFENNFFHGYGVYQWGPFKDSTGAKILTKRYEGEFKNGYRHGRGVFILGNGDTYSGEFVRGHYHGVGTLALHTGDTYSGNWKVGRPSGKIKIEYADGDVYEGETLIGKYDGKGRLVFKNNMGEYEGEWKRGLAHGKGTRIYANGSKYVGDFADGEIDGQGIMFFINGDQYVGEFRRGHLCGKGCYVHAFGDRYEGDFMHGYQHGEGKYTFADGGYYSGEYLNKKTIKQAFGAQEFPINDGIRHGFGIRVFTSGNRYEGKWTKGFMDSAQSVLIKADGSKYEGGFRNGQRSGSGREEFGNLLDVDYVCPLGHKHSGHGYCTYEGLFERDFFHGDGVFTCIDGRVYRGQYRNGKRHGKGYYYYLRDGDIGDPKRRFVGGKDSMYRVKEYDGMWEDNERCGMGVVTYVNNDRIEGNFCRGHPHGVCVYRFANGKSRHAEYCRGERLRWFDDAHEQAYVRVAKMKKFVAAAAQDELLLKEMDENTRIIWDPTVARSKN